MHLSLPSRAVSGRFSGLSGRLLLSLLAAHLLLAPLLVILILNAAAQNYKDRFIDQARSDAQWVQTLLGTLSPGVDRQMLMDDLALNTFRQSIQLFNTHHQRIAGAGIRPEPSPTGLHEDFEFGQHHDAVYWIELPLNAGADQPANTLLLGYDETPIAEDISRLYTHSLQLAALYLVLIAVIVIAYNRYLALIRDISEHKRLEEERRKHREYLAHARRLSSLGEMAAGLAHELNQPLAAINLYIQGSLRRLATFPACPPEIMNSLENASKQAQRAGDIISQIRGFIKKAPAENTATDINRLIRETLPLVEAELGNARVRVHLELAKTLPPLKLDRLQIQQALINLVSNGIEAMETTTAAHRQLTLQTRQTGSAVDVIVEDRGSGIPEDLADQLFTPFTSGKASGMGLGLAISRSIAEAHGGQLNFTARTGGGTRFILTLPVSKTPPADKLPTGTSP